MAVGQKWISYQDFQINVIDFGGIGLIEISVDCHRYKTRSL